MGISVPIVDGLFDMGGKLIDRLFPDPTEKAKARIKLMEMQQSGELQELETRMSAIMAEAESKDPWTSRARPSFLYVMYIMILTAIPMGVLHAFNPEVASGITEGMKAWLAAIPSEMWTLFGVGYLGYAGARSLDKRNIMKGKSK